MMGLIKDFRETPSSVKLILCLLVVGIIAIITIRGVVDTYTIKKVSELTIDKAKLEAKLEDNKEARIRADSLVSVYMEKYNEKKTDVIIEQIKQEENDEQTTISKLPLDDTVRNLSDWVRE